MNSEKIQKTEMPAAQSQKDPQTEGCYYRRRK